VVVERVVELVEEDRLGGDRRAGLGRVPPVVESHHDDLLGARDERRMLHGALLQKEPARTIGGRSHQRREHPALAVLEQIVGVQRRRQLVDRRGRGHVEDALRELHAQPGPRRGPHVQQRHVARRLEDALAGLRPSRLHRGGRRHRARGGRDRGNPGGGGL
jgi:hypothetical protein